MKKSMILIVLLLGAIFISSSSYAGNENGYVPSWKVGQRWIIEAAYRDLRGDGDTWMPSMQWIFNVRAQKNYNGEDCYVLHIYGRKSSQKNQAILWLSVKDLRPLKVIDVYPTSSGMKYKERDINANSSEPLVAEGTPIPYDMPSFPLTKSDNKAQSAIFGNKNVANTTAKKFSRIRNLGGIAFKRSVSQKVKSPDKQNSEALISYSKQSKTNGQSFQVEIAEDRSSNKLTQLWNQATPWAVSSNNRDKKVRLVPESEYIKKNGGEN